MSPVTSLLKNCLAVTSLLGMSVFQLDPKTFHNLWHIFAHIFVPLSFHTYIYVYIIYIHKCIHVLYIYLVPSISIQYIIFPSTLPLKTGSYIYIHRHLDNG